MINFLCKCGHRFSVPDDQVGASEQCPDCKLLVDVPHLDDLQNLEDDGTYKIDQPPSYDDPAVVQEMRRTYVPHRDAHGEYDLRPTARQVIESGVEEIPLKEEEANRPNVPKYDPITGELVRPMPLKHDDAPIPQAIPVAKPVVPYAAGYTADGVRPWMVPVALLMPANIAVIAVVFLLHLFNQIFVVALGGGLIFISPLPLLALMMIAAHYANVVDDVGRMERDELPGPGRGLSWAEDIWHPFVAAALAFIICYAPALFLYRPGGLANNLASALLAGAGTLLFPAVFLTAATSGTAYNLRPDRLLKVIWVSRTHYLPVLILWVGAALPYAVSLTAVSWHALTMMQMGGSVTFRIPLVVFYAMLLASVYLMHMFCWYLGLMYRKYQPQFPWILQQHQWELKDEQELRRLQRQRQRAKRVKPPQALDPPNPHGFTAKPTPVTPLPPTTTPALLAPNTTPTPLNPATLAGARTHLMEAMRRADEDWRNIRNQ